MDKLKNAGAMLIIVIVVAATLSCGVFKSTAPSTPTNSPIVITPVVPLGIETVSPSDSPESQSVVEEPQPILTVAYIKEGNVWLWRAGDSTAPVTDIGNVLRLALSSDGEYVAFEHGIDDYHSELWVVNTETHEQQMCVSVDEFNNYDRDKWLENAKSLVPYHFDFVPSTHILAYNTRQTFEGPGLALLDDLRLVNIDTNEKQTLLPSGQGGEFVYSPNGKQIAIISPTTISLVNSDGSNRREVLTYDLVSTYSEYSYYALPIWAADSSSLRVVIPPADPLGMPQQATTLWSIPTDGNSAIQLGSIMVAPFGSVENAFSPDFSHVIYTSIPMESEQKQLELHLAEPSGANDVLLTSNQYVAFYGWVPDSQHYVIYIGEPITIQLGDLNKNFRPLIEDTNGVGNVTWVSSNEFLFIKGGDGFWELHLGALEGENSLIDTITGSPTPYDYVFK